MKISNAFIIPDIFVYKIISDTNDTIITDFTI